MHAKEWESHIPESLTATACDFSDKNAEFHEWTMHKLNSKTVNAFSHIISADRNDVGSVPADGTFAITGMLEEDHYYIAFLDWDENQYAYTVK